MQSSTSASSMIPNLTTLVKPSQPVHPHHALLPSCCLKLGMVRLGPSVGTRVRRIPRQSRKETGSGGELPTHQPTGYPTTTSYKAPGYPYPFTTSTTTSKLVHRLEPLVVILNLLTLRRVKYREQEADSPSDCSGSCYQVESQNSTDYDQPKVHVKSPIPHSTST